MNEQEKRVPDHDGYHTDSVDDLQDLLHRAENWVEADVGFSKMALEFREARVFVEDELQKQDLVADGGD